MDISHPVDAKFASHHTALIAPHLFLKRDFDIATIAQLGKGIFE
ncbi:MAG: hypothetical protein WBC13_13045 [Dokdonella sp.]